jgi:hypothetical protein
MAEKGNTSKLARALSKDLQGERVVYRNFKEGEISILRDGKKKNLAARRGFFAWSFLWKIVLLIFFFNMSAFLYFEEYKDVELTKDLTGWADASKNNVSVKERTPEIVVVKADKTVGQKQLFSVGKSDELACMLKKSAYGNTTFTMKKEFQFAENCLQTNGEKIYCWDDAQGVTHFSNKGFPASGSFFPNWVKYY